MEIFVIFSPHCLTFPPMSNRRLSFPAALAMAILALGAPGVQGASPSLKATGLVTVETNTMVFLENSFGTCFFLKEGEAIPAFEDPIVLRINRDAGQVLIRYHGQTNELELPNGTGTNQSAVILQSASSDGVLEAYQVIAGRTLLSPRAMLPRSKISLMLSKGATRADILLAMREALRKEEVFLKDIGDKIVIAYAKPQSNLVDTLPPLPAPAKLGEVTAPGAIRLCAADFDAVLDLYAELVERTLLLPAFLPSPKISLKNQAACTREETIWMMETLLRLHGIELAYRGDKFVCVGLKGQTELVPEFPPEAAKGEAVIGSGTIRLQDADPALFFKIYAAVSSRELVGVPPGNIGRITFRNQRALTKAETLYALEALATIRWLKFENVGDTQIKVISKRPQPNSSIPKGNSR
jgi:hypothetical protein